MAEPRPGSIRAVFANLGWLLGGRGVNALLSLGYIAIVTRTLGPIGFGQFALIVGAAQTITALVGFQSWQIIVRYGLSHLHHRRVDALARLLKAAILLDFGGAAIGACIAVLAVWWLAPAFGWSPSIAHDALVFALVTLLAVRSAPIGILRLYDRYGVAAVADTAVPIARIIGALIVLATGPGLRGFLIVWGLAELASATTFWAFALRACKGLPWRATPLRWGQLRAENEGILRLAGVTNASTTFDLASKQAAVLLVGLFASPAAAGGFRLAHQLGQAMARLSQLFSRALFPELVRAKDLAADPLHFAALLGRTFRLSAIAGAVILGMLIFVGKPLLGFVAGPAFLSAAPLLLLLGGAAVIDMLGVAFEPTLLALGRAGLVFRLRLASVCALLGLMIPLLMRYGAIGAGWALLGGSAIQCTLFGLATWRTIRRSDPAVSAVDAAIVIGDQGEDMVA